jgi:hypothetical protein
MTTEPGVFPFRLQGFDASFLAPGIVNASHLPED